MQQKVMNGNYRFNNLLGLCTLILLLAKPSLQECEIQEIATQIHGSPFGEPPNLSTFPGYPHPYTPMPVSKFAKCKNEKSIENVAREIAGKTSMDGLQYLEITNSQLNTLKEGFLNFSKILKMRLSDCDIHNIEIDTFGNLGSLQRLELDNNKIRDLGQARFSNLRNLTILDLSFNDIDSMTENTFQGSTKLKQLNLQNNMLTVIKDNIFRDLANLEILNLAFNKIKAIHRNAFQKLPNLMSLYLNNNEFEDLDRGLFSGNTKLKELYTNNNNQLLLDIPNLPATCITLNASRNIINGISGYGFGHIGLDQFSKVEILDLSYTSLYTVSASVNMSAKQLYLNGNHLGIHVYDWWNLRENIFKIFSRLEELFLDNNEFRKIEEDMFAKNTLLKTLRLSGNSLQEFDARQVSESMEELNLNMNSLQKLEHLNRLKNLTKLQLGFNSLTHISANLFEGLTKLSELLLNNNRLRTLELGCFRDLKNLYLLDLSHNQIVNLDLGIFGGLSQLQTLNLAHNQLTTLEGGILHSSEDLLRLDISYNELTYLDVEATLSHFSWKIELSLEGNNWSCSFIVELIQKHKSLSIKQGNQIGVTNVRGITCTKNNKDGATSSNQNDSAKQYAENSGMRSGRLITNVVLILILLLLIVKFFVWRHLKNGCFFLKRPREDHDIQMVS